MAENKILEREYVIPLRRVWVNVPEYRRSAKAIKAIKIFIAKHMKVVDRDINKVKLDVYFNNEVWFRGRTKPPAKVKVKAIKEGDIVRVNFVETPDYVKFLKAKHAKMHQAASKKAEVKEQEVKEQKTEEEKKDEVEKEKSVEQQNIKQAEQEKKAQKHFAKAEKNKTHPTRMALKK